MGFWDDLWQKPVLAVTGSIIAPFFALGAGINQLTGGKTTTYNVFDAAGTDLGFAAPLAGPAGWTAGGPAPPPTYSNATQWLSEYQGQPDAGS